MASISVVVPTFRRPLLLERCLRSLFAEDLSQVREVILVVHDDDAAGLAEALRWKQRSPLVRVVYTKHASRSAARNAAATVCEGDWCYFIDDDVLVPPGTLRKLARAIGAHPQAAAIGGPNRIPQDSGPFERCVERVLGSRLGAGTMRARYCGLDGESWVDERCLIACNLAVRSRDLRGDIPFHPWLDYGEETLFLARLRLAGRRLLHDSRLWVYHRRREGYGSFCRQAFLSGRGRARQTCLMPASLSAEFLGPPALVLLTAAAPWLGPWAAGLLSAYAAACLANGAWAGWRERSLPIGLWTAALVPSGHLAFGLGLWLFPLAGPVRPRAPGRGWATLAGQWVLRARSVPALDVLFRGYYRASLQALRLWVLASGLRPQELWLRRGLTGPDWTPGGSDVDLAAEIPALDIDRELAWLDRWHRGFRRLRRLFPILGETQLATRAEWRRYVQEGDIRALELPVEARPLLGQACLPQRTDPGLAGDSWLTARRSLDLWSEQLHAYVRLAQLFSDESADGLRAAFNARKSLLDVSRYGRVLRGPAPAADRAESWRALSRAETARLCEEDGRAAPALARLDAAREPDEVRAAVEAALPLAAQDLEDSARLVRRRVPEGESPAAAPSEGTVFSDPEKTAVFARLCGKLEAAAQGQLTGALHDNVHHWLLGVPDGPLSDETLRAWRSMRDLRREEAALAQVLLPLPPEAFRLALWSSYLEDPLQAVPVLAGLRRGGDAQACTSGSSPLLGRHVLSLWKLSSAGLSAPPRPLAEGLLRESLAHLLVNWRSLESPDRREDDYCRWVYLYGRVLTLRLFSDKGEAWPAFPLEPLARRFAEAYPEEKPWLEEQVLAAAGIGDWEKHRGFFARQLRQAQSA